MQFTPTRVTLKLSLSLAAVAVVALSASCRSVPPNKPGVGDHHVFIPGIEAETPSAVTAADALARLKDGNKRYSTGNGGASGVETARSLARVKTTGADGQKPFASVLTCADSRTPPEIFFDQGVGDIFVVRVAGNVTDTMGLASLEYGVDHLGIPLIVVVGHSKCGAVDAAVKSIIGGKSEPHHEPEDFSANLPALVAAIEPAAKVGIQDASTSKMGGIPAKSSPKILECAVRANVLQTMRQLRERSGILAREANAGDILIVGAIYDVDTGAIEWLPAPTPTS